ncbi:Carboxylesterase [Bertholletia excelsa]
MARSKRKSQTSPPGGLPLKLKFLIAAHTFAFNASRRPDGSLHRCLMNLFDPKSPATRRPIKGVAFSNVTVDASLNLWFRLYTPSLSPVPNDPALPFILFFHAGGFALSAANSKVYDDFCRRLAFHVPAIVASVNYCRSPEHPFPTPYDDGITTLKFIDDVQEGSFLPAVTDLSRSFIAGDSAGGNIAHHVAARAGEHVFKKVKIRGLFWKAFLPKGADRNHVAASVWSADISATKFLETMLAVGGYDLLQDWQRRYERWLKECRKLVQLVEYPNAVHVFMPFQDCPNLLC